MQVRPSKGAMFIARFAEPINGSTMPTDTGRSGPTQTFGLGWLTAAHNEFERGSHKGLGRLDTVLEVRVTLVAYMKAIRLHLL
jgi:hypothetical protein